LSTCIADLFAMKPIRAYNSVTKRLRDTYALTFLGGIGYASERVRAGSACDLTNFAFLAVAIRFALPNGNRNALTHLAIIARKTTTLSIRGTHHRTYSWHAFLALLAISIRIARLWLGGVSDTHARASCPWAFGLKILR
jgi:hypothetical protein